jgi:hypothetical protein
MIETSAKLGLKTRSHALRGNEIRTGGAITCYALTILLFFIPISRADQFESVEGKQLAEALKGPNAKAVDRLTIADIGTLPNILRDARAPLLAVKTASGNVARLIINPELRKSAEPGGKPIPVYLIERFDTFDAADYSLRIAKGREMMLFPGFEVDLDTGQIVPEGQGGDLAYSVKDGQALVALKGATLYTFDKLPAPDPTKPPQPTPGRAVVPVDFAGRYRLFANGQWAGTLDLTVEGKELSGRFRSDTHGATYPVTGQVASDAANKASLVLKFPRARGEFEAYLWTEGKGALAGTFRLLDHTYGFFAVREGSRFAPADSDVRAVEAGSTKKDVIEIEMIGDRFKLEGKEMSLDGLVETLKPRAAAEPLLRVIVFARADASYREVSRMLEAIHTAGLRSVHVALPGEAPDPR